MANKIFVEKGFYEKGGNKFSTFFVKAQIKGKELKATLVPPDKGGYQILDLIFDNIDKTELIVKPFEMKDAASGSVIKGNTYFVATTDEKGNAIECKVVPFKNSDKSIMQMLIK